MAARRPVYAALIGDLVASRSLSAKSRRSLQSALETWLESLNQELQQDLAAPLTLTAGDELQALFRKPSALVTVVQELTDRMFQFEGQPQMLFGVGRGELTTGPIPAAAQAPTPARLDGPAFHNARAALEHVRDQGGWVRFLGFGSPPGFVADRVLDALFVLMGALRERWTLHQGRMSFRMRARGEASQVSQREFARELGVSPSVVSESLKAARHLQLLEGEEAARELLATFDHP